jgi:hypothetical protein
MFLESTYHFEGESVIIVAGYEGDDDFLYADAVFVHPHLDDDIYILVNKETKEKFRIRLKEEMFSLSAARLFHMTMLKREKLETI